MRASAQPLAFLKFSGTLSSGRHSRSPKNGFWPEGKIYFWVIDCVVPMTHPVGLGPTPALGLSPRHVECVLLVWRHSPRHPQGGMRVRLLAFAAAPRPTDRCQLGIICFWVFSSGYACIRPFLYTNICGCSEGRSYSPNHLLVHYFSDISRRATAR